MAEINDFTWSVIVKHCNPDPRFRVSLGRIIEYWRLEFESSLNYMNYKYMEDEIAGISCSVDDLVEKLSMISNRSYAQIIREIDKEKILNILGPGFSLGDHENMHSYYHREVIGRALPFLKALINFSKTDLRFREISAMKKRISVRDGAIESIEENLYVFGGGLLRTGKNGSGVWIGEILNAIGCYTTDNSVETALRKWIKHRDSSDHPGESYYSHRDTILRDRIMSSYNQPIEKLVYIERSVGDLI